MQMMRLTAIIVVGLAGFGCYAAARLLYAEGLAREATVGSVEQALRVTPGRADLHERLARAVPEKAIPELQAALRLDPREAAWWQELAVQQELAGDTAGAEKSLLTSAAVSRYYLPRWALADFYYRQEKREPFRHWAREALAMAPGDPAPVFQMAHNLNLPDQDILNLVPARANVLAGFLQWYEQTQSNTINIPVVVSELLSKDGQKQFTWASLNTVDWLFAGGRVKEAAEVWNQLVAAHQAPVEESIDLAAGHSLVDSELRHVRENGGGGFGWRSGSAEGITMTPSRSGGGVLIEANGKESDKSELMTQNLPLLAGRKYQLSAQYDVQGANSGEGLWFLVTPSSQTAQKLDLKGAQPNFTMTFTVPGDSTGAAKLVLLQERPLGATRWEGAVQLHSVRLELRPE